jgi:hypothetical protein
MKIFWIDDLKESTTAKDIVASVLPHFNGFLDESLQKDLERLGNSKADDKKSRSNLSKILRGNTHPIFWYDGFVNGLNAMVEESFDFFILDADLPHDKKSIEMQRKEASSKTNQLLEEFVKEGVFPSVSLEAGFTLYWYLVKERGFPKDRVVFLSGNAGEAETILEHFHKAKAIPPKKFSKNSSDKAGEFRETVEEFRETLVEFSQNEYLNLRRGILDVLPQIRNQSPPKQSPFGEDSDDPINGEAFSDGLRFLLNDQRIPSTQEEIQQFYLVLCDYLTKPFERFSRGYRNKYVMPAYFMRNWIAHGVMSNSQSKLSAKDVGFVFIIVIKSLFDYSCLEAFKTLYTSHGEQIDLIGLLSELHEYYSSPPECDIFELIRLKGEKKLNIDNWQNEPFVVHLYASFLFHALRKGAFSETRDGQKQYKQTRIKLHPDQKGYDFQLNYRVDDRIKEVLFEDLKAIVYHRLQELKPLLPS